MKYCDEADRPLYEFGEGFGYGQLSYEKMSLEKTEDGGVMVTVTATNLADRSDWAVPQIYLSDIASSTVRRVRELKAFSKEKLKANETKKILLKLDREAFFVWDFQMKETLEPGEFEILLMDQGKIWDRQSIWF